MRIVFPFGIKQIHENEVEVKLGNNGLPLPEVHIGNASLLTDRWGVSDVDLEKVHEELETLATESLVRNSMRVLR